jgi:ubiquinone/menaquinone biosynthesis C-methylase UbiE
VDSLRGLREREPESYEQLAGRSKFVCDWFKAKSRGDEILEIGSGTGWFAKFLTQNMHFGSYVGLEIENSARDIALKYVSDSRVTFCDGSGLRIPLPDSSIDTCVTFDVIEHIPKGTEKEFFCEIFRVLKPGGVMFLSTPNHHVLSTYLDPAFFLLGHRHYSAKELDSVATAIGFNVVENFSRGGMAEVAMLHNLYFSKWVLSREPLFYKQHSKLMESSYQKETGFMNRFLLVAKPEIGFKN